MSLQSLAVLGSVGRMDLEGDSLGLDIHLAEQPYLNSLRVAGI